MPFNLLQERENSSVLDLEVEKLFSLDTVISERGHEPQRKDMIVWQMSPKKVVFVKERVTELLADPISNRNRFILFDLFTQVAENEELKTSILWKTFEQILSKIEVFLYDKNPYLLSIIKQEGTFKEKIWKVNFLLEHYSFETAEHTEEVWLIATALAEFVNKDCDCSIDISNFKDFWQFHDLWKLLIPSEILMKPWKLTDEEFFIIKRHPIYSSILIKIFLYYSSDRNYPKTREYAERLIETALYHHKQKEGWYPLECSSDRITIESEIIRLADIYQALSSRRCYKEKFDPTRVEEMIEALQGTFKHKQVFETFFKYKRKFDLIMSERKEIPSFFETVWHSSIDKDHAEIENQVEIVYHSTFETIKLEYWKLILLIKQHFINEEQEMEISGFPFIEKHKKIHKELIHKTENLITQYFWIQGEREDILDFIKKFISVWFKRTYFLHSKIYDWEFVQWLNTNSAMN